MLDAPALTRAFAQAANGHSRAAVVNAGGNMILNAIRQNNDSLNDAQDELVHLFERMAIALREKHYVGGKRRVTNIIVNPPVELIEELQNG